MSLSNWLQKILVFFFLNQFYPTTPLSSLLLDLPLQNSSIRYPKFEYCSVVSEIINGADSYQRGKHRRTRKEECNKEKSEKPRKMKGFMEGMFGGQENLLYQERITRLVI